MAPAEMKELVENNPGSFSDTHTNCSKTDAGKYPSKILMVRQQPPKSAQKFSNKVRLIRITFSNAIPDRDEKFSSRV
jgi:hypothetical protein